MYEDFGEAWLSPLKKSGIKLLGLHADPRRAGVGEFLDFVEGNRALIGRFEKSGIRVEYKLHTLNYLLPRELFASDSALFRMNQRGERTDDYNACPSSAEALALIERAPNGLPAYYGKAPAAIIFGSMTIWAGISDAVVQNAEA